MTDYAYLKNDLKSKAHIQGLPQKTLFFYFKKTGGGPKHALAMYVSGESKIIHERVFPVGQNQPKKNIRTEACWRTISPAQKIVSIV
jgi:hypothetical protein